jgi:hypothetical protein
VHAVRAAASGAQDQSISSYHLMALFFVGIVRRARYSRDKCREARHI